MSTTLFFKRYGLLRETSKQLSRVESLEGMLEILRSQARAISGADGVAVIRREGDRVHYLGEDAITPLWAGQSFPIERCISGLAILERRPIAITDIMADDRVPHAAYLATFVKSMAVFPLGAPNPTAALGLYWREVRPLSADVEALMSFLTRDANDRLREFAIAEASSADCAA